jgi:3'-phosphoadenosine 5'-phosphosulfate (PAPS) 3'-phosphatase
MFFQAKEAGLNQQSLRMDSQVKYGLLARGDAARVFMRFPPATYREKIWDHAAGVVVVEEAGGKVTDALGNPLDFSRGRYLDLMQFGIIAAPPSVHSALVKAVATVRNNEILKREI